METNPQPQTLTPPKRSALSGLMWWVTLIMAVVALPMFGAMVALSATKVASMQMAIFMLTCWVCIWLGMWLMRKAHVHHFGHHHHH